MEGLDKVLIAKTDVRAPKNGYKLDDKLMFRKEVDKLFVTF